MSDASAFLEPILVVLTSVLAILTVALVALAIKAENRLTKLVRSLENLVRIQLLLVGATVERAIEIPVQNLTKKIEEVVYDLYDLPKDAHIEAGFGEKYLVVSYRLSWEPRVFALLKGCVDDAKCLGEEVYLKLGS